MQEINFWPGLVFLFAAFNLSAWFFHGQPLFSWWWLIVVIIVEVIFKSLTLAILKTALRIGE